MTHNSVDRIIVLSVVLRGLGKYLWSRFEVQLYSWYIDNRVRVAILREFEFDIINANLNDLELSVRNWCELGLVDLLSS